MSWLDLLLKSTEEFEAPERYFWWSGLAAISAAVRKNIWLDRYAYTLYPNIYVALISAKSGGKKGIPINVCRKLLQEANVTRIISGNNSIQGIIQELSQQKTLANGLVISDAHGILLSGELDSFLTDDPKGLSYLTDLYNTHEHEKGWEKTLKNSPKQELKSPCLTMLVASNEMLFSSVVKTKDIEGGFVGRTILVKESRTGRMNSLAHPPKFKIDYIKLSERLAQISKIKGEFQWTDEVRDLYDDWYQKFYSEETDDRTGTYNRFGDHVLKTAMLISLAEKDDLNLEWENIQLAIEKCGECVGTAVAISPSTESANGDKANAMKLLCECLIDAALTGQPISKMAILNKLQRYQVTTTTVDYYIRELINLDRIAEKKIEGKGHVNTRIFYTLTNEGLEYLGWKTKKHVH